MFEKAHQRFRIKDLMFAEPLRIKTNKRALTAIFNSVILAKVLGETFQPNAVAGQFIR
jgi:hypothetical protein